jgi:hypothetical protein
LKRREKYASIQVKDNRIWHWGYICEEISLVLNGPYLQPKEAYSYKYPPLPEKRNIRKIGGYLGL